MFSRAQQFYSNVPDLIITPFFTNGSTWPSYYIKPFYNDIGAQPVKNEDLYKESESVNSAPINLDNPVYYQNYMNTAGSLAANISMQPHTHHTNQMGQQYMYPTMPYYIPATNVGERVNPVVYQPNSIYSQNAQTGVAV
tara:strand:+ start:2107 stop:2523 length:417 start_codon:yes stop_codon:yes gene_type:complete